MGDAQAFAAELDAFAAQVMSGENVEEWAMDLARRVMSDIVDLTRIKTGRAKASYVASKDVPVYITALALTPKTPLGAEEAKQRSLATVENLRGFRMGQTLYITNGAPYISRLNDGVPGTRYSPPDAMFNAVQAKYRELEPDLTFDIIR